MELRFKVSEFSRALANTQGIVQKRNTMPILANVLVRASDKGDVELVATDLDIGVQIDGTAEVIAPGSVTVNARALYDIVKSLPAKEATFKKLPNNYVEIRTERAQYKIIGASEEEFPSLPAMKGLKAAKIPAAVLREMVEKTFYSVSTDETRYNLSGVFFEPQEDGAVVMVSTDGHRLSHIVRKLEADFGLEEGVILPRKGINELRRLLESGGDTINFGVKGSHAVASIGGITIVMRLIDGKFPDYNQVIPKDTNKKARMGREELVEALRRISLVSSDKSHSIKVELMPGVLKLYCQNPDLGEGQEELSVEYDGEPIVIGFNARYLIDALNSIESKRVSLELNDDLSPGIIRGDDKGYLCVVMPMRI